MAKNPLKKNIYLFAVGTFFTNIIQFVFVPIYTFYLSTAQYGTIDLISSLSNIIIPLVSLSIVNSVFRFGADSTSDKKSVFTIGVLFCFIGSLLIFSVGFSVQSLLPAINLIPVCVYMCLVMFFDLFQYFIKSIDKVTIYVVSSICYALFSCGLALLLIGHFQMGIDGYFWAYSIGLFLSCLIMFFFLKLWKLVSFKSVNKAYLKMMLIYCIPLIFNSIGWWMINASDKYIALYFLGTDSNGILAVVHKIPTLLTVIYGIFGSAFQISAVKELNFEEKNKSEMEVKYSEIFNNMVMLLCVLVSAIILLIELYSRFFLESSFYTSWYYVPFYALGILFYCCASFLGNIYGVVKKNKNILISTIFCGLSNALLCFLIFYFWKDSLGLFACSISTVIAYLGVFLFRFFDTQKYLRIHINTKTLFVILLVSVQSILAFFLREHLLSFYIASGVLFLIIAVLSAKDVFLTIKKMLPSRN